MALMSARQTELKQPHPYTTQQQTGKYLEEESREIRRTDSERTPQVQKRVQVQCPHRKSKDKKQYGRKGASGE